MYSCEKLARGILQNHIRLEQCRKAMERQLKEILNQNQGKDLWPSNQYLVNYEQYCDRPGGQIERSEKL